MANSQTTETSTSFTPEQETWLAECFITALRENGATGNDAQFFKAYEGFETNLLKTARAIVPPQMEVIESGITVHYNPANSLEELVTIAGLKNEFKPGYPHAPISQCTEVGQFDLVAFRTDHHPGHCSFIDESIRVLLETRGYVNSTPEQLVAFHSEKKDETHYASLVSLGPKLNYNIFYHRGDFLFQPRTRIEGPWGQTTKHYDNVLARDEDRFLVRKVTS